MPLQSLTQQFVQPLQGITTCEVFKILIENETILYQINLKQLVITKLNILLHKITLLLW
ncbi:hypothetical protein BN3087_210011 [Sulfurovum sp. enrichment culture clone C5]|uniref:Uncharacterized protein n=1 Tax=Sulfurovum sp. enrichment culture clone C5 TaxID=497650 RepID=A0A0S4XMD7_9BACT|nr:hypothetical protein BN3087_210011 [Sulfurovum sp. enrichment culture clone C5]